MNYKFIFPLVFFSTIICVNALSLGDGQALEWLSMIPLKCPLRWLTGIVCPTCGLGHSLFYSFKFSFVQAATHHPLGPIFFGLGLLFNFAILMGRAEELIVGTRALGQRFATMNSGAFAFIIYCIWGFSRNF